MLQSLIDLDTSIFLSLNACHNSFWDVFMPLYSSKYVWAFFYLSLVYVIARNYSWRLTLLWVVGAVVVITLCDQVTASLIRPVVARLRPSNLQNPLSEVVHVVNGYRGGNYSFPSAHAANSWGGAMYVMLLLRKRWLAVIMVAWALLTCYSRVYLGVHYFGDLLTGMGIGCIVAALVYYPTCRLLHVETPRKVVQWWVPVATLGGTVTVFLAIATYQVLSR